MSDILYTVLMLGLCLATVGLVVLCDRLMPRESGGGHKP